MAGPRRYVLVSGAPGAGKSTLARPLAAALGWPLVSKDVLKETIFDALGTPPGDLAASRRVGAAAMEALWAVAADAPAAVLEANFRPHSDYERGRIAGLGGAVVEVHCRCAPAEAARRFRARAAGPGHHPAHGAASLPADVRAAYDGPLALGPVVEVDTTGPVDVASVAARVRATFAALR